jgi:glycosyltransferase involved in cell wall biosynthesis
MAENPIPQPPAAFGQRAPVVVQLLLGTEGGGIITAIRQWAPLLIEHGWDVHFVVLSEGRAVEMLRAAGFEPTVMPLGGLRRYTCLGRLLRPMNPAILHAHNPSSHLIAIEAARRLGCRVVRTVHADMFEEMRGTLPRWKIALWRMAMGWALRRAHGLIVVSPHLLDRLPGIERPADGQSGFGEYRRPGGVIDVMPNGFDPREIDEDRHGLPADLSDWLGASPMALSMGRLVAVKNYALLLDAWRLVVDRMPEAKLVLAGSGPQREMLERRRDELGLGDSVRMLPWVDRIAPLLHRCSVVVLSSRSECCPMLVFEAMSASRPVASTAVGGVPYLVDDGETGILVEAEDAAALAEGVLRILGDPEHGAAIGRAGRAKLEREFTHTLAAQGIARIFQRTMAQSVGVP